MHPRTLAPYFRVADGKMAAFKALYERIVAQTQSEPDCLFYGFCFDGDNALCREGYKNAAALLAHQDNVGAILQEALQVASIQRLEVHGREQELASPREPLAGLDPQFFTLETGFRR